MKFINKLSIFIIVLIFISSVKSLEEFENDENNDFIIKCPRNSINDFPSSLNVTMHITQIAQLTVKSFEDIHLIGDSCNSKFTNQEIYIFGYGSNPQTNLDKIYYGSKFYGSITLNKGDGKPITKNQVSFTISKIESDQSFLLKIFN